MSESNRLVHQVRQKAKELTGEGSCSWCFRKFPIEKLTLRKRGNGHKAHICPTCLSNMKPKSKL
jgi:hypothetical protein